MRSEGRRQLGPRTQNLCGPVVFSLKTHVFIVIFLLVLALKKVVDHVDDVAHFATEI